MDLVQCRMVSDDVEGLAEFYARLLGVAAALNEYYVEIQAGPASVGFSRRRFTEHREAGGVILDSQPWGSRSMMFRDPAGNLVNVFSRPD